jgi:hypothetical protein
MPTLANVMAPPHELNVNLNFTNCGAGPTILLSSEDARRCGFSDPDENLPKAHSPTPEGIPWERPNTGISSVLCMPSYERPILYIRQPAV